MSKVGGPSNRLGQLESRLSAWLRPGPKAKPGTSVPATQPAARVAIVDGDGSTIAGALARGAAFNQVTAPQWQRLATYVQAQPAAAQQKLTADLALRGLQLIIQPGGSEISVMSETAQATVDLKANEVRVGNDSSSKVFRGGTLLEAIETTPQGLYKVTRDGQPQLWDPLTGQGSTLDGHALPTRFTPVVPGEAARKPWPKPLASKLVEPEGGDGKEELPAFWKLYNDAVVKSGGNVVEPLSLLPSDAVRYNCHSFATTGAQGDLLDPFDAPDQPRWVNFPTYQLTNGPFTKLKADQQVHVGDVILYADADGVPTHTGKVTAVDKDGNPSQIESKWGAYGLYRHGPFDVPSLYGHIDSFYRPDAVASA